MTTNNTKGAIPENFLQWIEETRPHDTDLDFTPAEAGYQNGYIAGAKRAYRKLTKIKATEVEFSEKSYEVLAQVAKIEIDRLNMEIQDYRKALMGIATDAPLPRTMARDMIQKYSSNHNTDK